MGGHQMWTGDRDPNKVVERDTGKYFGIPENQNQKKERQISASLPTALERLSTPIFAGDVERQWYQQALATDQALKRAKTWGDPYPIP